MKQQNNYTLYFLRAFIVILIAWLSSAMFNSAINSNENALQQSLIQNQQKATVSLSETRSIEIKSLEKLLFSRPDDKILLEHYLLIDTACNLALDTLNELFDNQNLSAQQLTKQIKVINKNLNNRLLTVLNKVAKTNPIITNEEIIDLHSSFSSFQYFLKNNNRQLLQELAINQIEQIKTTNLSFISSKVGRTMFHHYYSDPFIILPTFRKNKLGKIKVILTTNEHRLIADSLNINHEAFPLRHGVAKYSTIYKDTLLKNMIVGGSFQSLNKPNPIILQDTFKIYPNQKH